MFFFFKDAEGSEIGTDAETAEEKLKEDSESEMDDPSDIRKQPSFLSVSPTTPPSFEEELTSNEVVMPIYSRVHLRPNYTPYWVYCGELESSVTLVILNKNAVCAYFFFYQTLLIYLISDWIT